MIDFGKKLKVHAIRREGYQLMHDGIIELAYVEANGIRIDVPRLEKTTKTLTEKVRELKYAVKEDPIFAKWKKRFGDKANITSHAQLATMLFSELKIKPSAFTDKGKPSTDDEALQKIDLPFVKHWATMQRYEKARGTFLAGIAREVVGERLHPSFNLHTARTYRSCIAKGTLIEVVRDISKYPKGIPIENVKEGDYVYCYDDQLKLTLKRVMWAGKTGHREVIRIHWGAKGKKGYLDLTPEHRVRLVDGRYVEARNLVGDLRSPGSSKHAPKIGVLSMARDGDRLYETGLVEPLWDHRLVYEKLVGPLGEDGIVHHKDRNHFNNLKNNLERKTLSSHSKDHALAGHYWTQADREWGGLLGNLKRRVKGYLTGQENPLWIHFTKFQLLRMLARVGGLVVKVPYDFDTLRNKARLLGVDLKAVKDRYDKNGIYISRGRLLRAFDGTLVSVVNAFGANYEKVERLLKQRGLTGILTKPGPNPYGRRGKPNNHKILRIEYIKKKVDVYDLDVEDLHNFIAGEICVHNSSDSPNFQNFPVRDKEISEIIRSHFIPSPGCVLVENDFKGVEVGVSACYHKDPNFISYITTPGKDMHRDMAAQIYMLRSKEVHKDARYGAKNKFVFPQFYGDFYIACAKALWEWIDKGLLKGPDGNSLYEHLALRGIKELGECNPEEKPVKGTFEFHLKQIEDDFWNHRFAAYGQWRKDWYKQYLDRGYFDLLSGFRVYGSFRRNQVTNYPVQGSAFHCLLWTLTQVNQALRKYNMKSKIVGQIHDSMLGDVRINELTNYLEIVQETVDVKLRKHYTWINVPLEVECEISPENGTWYDKRPVVFKDGRYFHPQKKDKFTTDVTRFLEILKQKELFN